MKNTVLILFLLALGCMPAQSQNKTKNIILMTIDGFRWQEVFSGADSSLAFNPEYTRNQEELTKKYWDSDPLKRREKLMPFLWTVMAKKGQIYGNRNLGSFVNVANPYWFSYPGYSEILCGFADEKVNSNDLGPNPNTTLLEFLAHKKEFEGKVAVFASWGTLNDIVNEERSHVLVNAGFDPLAGEEFGEKVQLLNDLQYQLPDIFSGIRLDAATFHMGFEYMKTNNPRVIHISFDETDDFAHFGSYDNYMNSARYTDEFIRQIWEWVQNQPGYKDQTTLLVTVDHGRGIAEGWKSHGAKTAHSDETWFAVIGPDTPAKGEMTTGRYFSKQFAATMAGLLSVDYTNTPAPAQAIQEVMGK